MLVLTRRLNDAIVLNDNIVIKVCEIGRNKVRLAIEAPDDVKILRGELVPFELPIDIDQPAQKRHRDVKGRNGTRSNRAGQSRKAIHTSHSLGDSATTLDNQKVGDSRAASSITGNLSLGDYRAKRESEMDREVRENVASYAVVAS